VQTDRGREGDDFAPQIAQADRASVLVDEFEGHSRDVRERGVAVYRLCEEGVANGVRRGGHHWCGSEQHDADGADRGEAAKGIGRPRGETAPPAECALRGSDLGDGF